MYCGQPPCEIVGTNLVKYSKRIVHKGDSILFRESAAENNSPIQRSLNLRCIELVEVFAVMVVNNASQQNPQLHQAEGAGIQGMRLIENCYPSTLRLFT
jgi:hypothetical protein